VEHHAVLHTCNYLEEFGFDVTYLPVDGEGRVSADDVARAVTDRTVLVSVMLANNEVGTLQPVRDLVHCVAERGRQLRRKIPVHTDAIAAAGSLSLDVESLGVDLLSLSGHKFGGPKGTGVLYIRRGTPFVSQLTGGGQERQRRAGTENVAGIVGQAVALTLAEEGREAATAHTRHLRDRLMASIPSLAPEARLNGHATERLASNVNMSFRGVPGDKLVAALDKKRIAVSAGAACGSQTWEPSHVLLAMGLSMPEAVGGLRVSLSTANTDAEVDKLIEVLPGVVRGLRGSSGS
jgi:cysteine desulfurase